MRIGSFPNVGKTAGVVLVDSPEVAAEIQSMYPTGSAQFILDPSVTGMGMVTKATIHASAITMAIGGIVGALGYMNHRKGWGQLLMGAGGSMIGTGLVFLIRDSQE